MVSGRPDPERLLHLIEDEEKSSHRGKLKIFFGASAGVGKTYAMLHAAHELLSEGVKVIIGVVETHGRPETEELLVGLPKLPTRSVSHKGIVLQEFDLDAALQLKPDILLLDELAHSNPIGSRHPKRWQDVKELLEAGIDVHTTLNVQHLESLNDVVARITGVSVKETVSDIIFDQADEITLVDIPTDELLDRLKEGKVYLSSNLMEAARLNFFKRSNLIALREMALRRTAERVDAQMKLYNITEFAGGEILSPRLMVCVGPDLLSLRLVRATKRMADRIGAPWFAVYVQNEKHLLLSTKEQERLDRTLRIAEQMGGKVEYIYEENALKELIAFAKKKGVTRIVIGKTSKPRWREIIFGSLADGLIRASDGIEITVISSFVDESNDEKKQLRHKPFNVKPYIYSFISVSLATIGGFLIIPYMDILNVIILYFITLTGIAAFFSKGPSLFAAFNAVLFLNLFFLDPKLDLGIPNKDYIPTFGMMFIISYFISLLSSRLKSQAMVAQKREKDTSLLYALTREFSVVRGHKAMAEIAARHLGLAFNAHIIFWMPNDEEQLSLFYPEHRSIAVKEEMVAKWSFEHGQIAGHETSTMPSAQGIYFPLIVSSKTIGTLGLVPKEKNYRFSNQQLSLLETFANLIASSFDRANTALVVEESIIEAESQRLRNILLASISQDLLVPLTTLTKFSHDLLQENRLNESEKKDILHKINQESHKISQIIDNIMLLSKKRA
jgi:two-component system, OmpR family, sensor histidine kinase KdpD